MLVLGIETTCDETGCALVEDGRNVVSNVVSSQVDLHRAYGGVVPEIACRRHVDVIIPIVDEALRQAKCSLTTIDLIAVAYGPGLIGALMIGLNCAKSLSLALNKPLIGINHVEAHLYAALMSHPGKVSFPCLGVVLSGGHTSLVLMHSIGSYQLISETVDDAIGEAFDKVAKLLNLPYPGGPYIEELAKGGDPSRYRLRAGQVKGKPYSFSFSGLKTAALYTVKREGNRLNCKDLAASFQQAAFTDVVIKTLSATKEFSCETVIFGGGVTNNCYLREMFNESSASQQLIWPLAALTQDNAAMIAGLGYHRYQLKGKDSLNLEVRSKIVGFPD